MLQSLYFKMLCQFTFPHNNFTGFRTVQTLGLIHKSAREHFKRFVQKSQIHPSFFFFPESWFTAASDYHEGLSVSHIFAESVAY